MNGAASEANVLVQSDFKPGSFVAGLQFVQSGLQPATQLLSVHQLLDATGLAAIIGFVWKNKDSIVDFYKWLKGKKPAKAVQVGNNVEVTLGESKKTVSNVVFKLYGDSAIAAALGRVTSPLRQADIDRIAVKLDGAVQTTFEKSESSYFEAEPFQLESDQGSLEGQRMAVLLVSKLSFIEGSAWTFIERGATVIAKIEDKEFWKKVHQRQVTFGEGDRLRVDLKWTVVRKRGKLTPNNSIVTVHEVLPRAKQMRLVSEKDDELK